MLMLLQPRQHGCCDNNPRPMLVLQMHIRCIGCGCGSSNSHAAWHTCVCQYAGAKCMDPTELAMLGSPLVTWQLAKSASQSTCRMRCRCVCHRGPRCMMQLATSWSLPGAQSASGVSSSGSGLARSEANSMLKTPKLGKLHGMEVGRSAAWAVAQDMEVPVAQVANSLPRLLSVSALADFAATTRVPCRMQEHPITLHCLPS